MRFDKIATPISAEEPCGPDLDEEGDDAYLNYVLSAAGRIREHVVEIEIGRAHV